MYRVLEAVAISESQSVRQSEICKRLKLSSTTVYAHVNALVKAQCIHKYGNGSISVTDEGRDRLAWLQQFRWVV